MNLQENNSSALDNTALTGLRRLAGAFNGSGEKSDAPKVAVMFMVTSNLKTDSTALTGGMHQITKEAIAQSIDTLQAVNTFLNEIVQALEALKDMKPPPGLIAETD